MLKVFPSGPFVTNAHVIFCKETQKAAIVDPAPGSLPTMQEFILKNGLQIEKILLTHSHWDHFADLKAAIKAFPVEVFVHPLDQDNVQNPGSDGLPMMLPIEAVEDLKTYQDQDQLSIGHLNWVVLHTPGHSPGSVCLYCEDQKVLISGDTLFKGSIGNISFPTAEPEKMWASLKRLSHLPKQTHVYPGHGPSTTIAEEPWLDHAEDIFN